MAKEKRFYVYQIRRGGEIVYVGKGSGRRAATSGKARGGDVEVVRRFVSEDAAFRHEAKLIERLAPALNMNRGGGGGRSAKASAFVPVWYRNAIREIERIGSRKYVARELLKLLPAEGRSDLGVSKLDMVRLRQVANG